MRVALWAYVVAYGLAFPVLFIFATVVTPPEERDPVWEQIADVVMYVTGLIGLLLYAQQVEHLWLKQGWKIVAPAFVLGHVWLDARGKADLDEGELTSPWLRAIQFVVPAFLAPCALLNLLYAFR